MARAVLFDLDGTLHDRASAVRLLLEAQYGQFEPRLRGVSREQYVRRALELDHHGYRDKREVFQLLTLALGLEPALAPALTAHFFEAYEGYVRAFPEALRVLAALRDGGLKLGIITNGKQHVQQRKIERLGFAPLMDAVLISEAEGLKKPDARIFQRAIERLEVSARDALYVGDHPLIDVRGAVEAGLSAVWRRTPAWPAPDLPHHAIETLAELPALVFQQPCAGSTTEQR